MRFFIVSDMQDLHITKIRQRNPAIRLKGLSRDPLIYRITLLDFIDTEILLCSRRISWTNDRSRFQLIYL